MSAAHAMSSVPEFVEYRLVLARWFAGASIEVDALERASVQLCRYAHSVSLPAEQLVVALREARPLRSALNGTDPVQRASLGHTHEYTLALDILLRCFFEP